MLADTNQRVIFYFLPSLAGLSTAIIIFWLTMPSMAHGVLVAGILIATGLLVGHILQKLAQADFRQLQEEKNNQTKQSKVVYKRAESYVLAVEELFIDAIPIIVKQIKTSKAHTEEEISILSERFAAMTAKIAELNAAQQDDDNYSINALLKGSNAILNGVISELSLLNEAEKTMIVEVRSLSKHTSAMDGMANDVRAVADNINLLSLNAAIEAARAGEYGRGFAVVADEIRMLAQSSSEMGSRISETVKAINSSINSALDVAETTSTTDNESIGKAESYIEKVLTDIETTLNSFKSKTDQLTEGNIQVQAEIFSLITALQFQDRVTQMLEHAEHNLNDLFEVIDKHQDIDLESRSSELVSVTNLLESMALRYTTLEEVDNHNAVITNTVEELLDSPKEDEELTFF